MVRFERLITINQRYDMLQQNEPKEIPNRVSIESELTNPYRQKKWW
jgi:hypothetical protein